jgi:hypothetical protein
MALSGEMNNRVDLIVAENAGYEVGVRDAALDKFVTIIIRVGCKSQL